MQLNFKMTYINYEGGISNYYPDFVIHLNNNERYIVETKGAENLDDPRKIERLKVWKCYKILKTYFLMCGTKVYLELIFQK